MIRGGYIQKRILAEWKVGPNMFIQSQIIHKFDAIRAGPLLMKKDTGTIRAWPIQKQNKKTIHFW